MIQTRATHGMIVVRLLTVGIEYCLLLRIQSVQVPWPMEMNPCCITIVVGIRTQKCHLPKIRFKDSNFRGNGWGVLLPTTRIRSLASSNSLSVRIHYRVEVSIRFFKRSCHCAGVENSVPLYPGNWGLLTLTFFLPSGVPGKVRKPNKATGIVTSPPTINIQRHPARPKAPSRPRYTPLATNPVEAVPIAAAI